MSSKMSMFIVMIYVFLGVFVGNAALTSTQKMVDKISGNCSVRFSLPCNKVVR